MSKFKLLLLIAVLSTGCARVRYHDIVGQDGAPGAPGQDGSSCGVEQLTNGARIACTNGTQAFISNGIDGLNGTNGQDGADGQDGEDGADGQDGQSIVGPQGPPGISPPAGAYDIVGIVEPCAATNREVLLRLRDGRLLAHYSAGSAQFLALLGPGTYQLTDGGPTCTFTVGAAPTYMVSN